jgi:quinol monooxygenase YgiN
MTAKQIATINAERALATLVSVFEVEPEKQAELARILSDGTEAVIRHQPGFVSVSIHSSLDGTRVVNYAQWESKEDIDRVMRNPEAQARLRQAAAVARNVAPAVYTVSAVHSG